MPGKQKAELGPAQQTLFIPLAARARETRRGHPVLRDPKAVEMVASIDYDAAKYGRGAGGSVTVMRTVIFDWWVREFLARHPAGTVVEVGTGLNTRFERVGASTAHWIDLDLPDTIELRREFFADTGRRTMLAASLADEEWLDVVERSPAPYFFACEGVLPYVPEADVTRTLARIAGRFPGALIALDTFPRRTYDQQHKLAARRGIEATWQWWCDDPASLEQHGLKLVESAWITRPPKGLRPSLPGRYRYLLPLANPVLGKSSFTLSLFETAGDGGRPLPRAARPVSRDSLRAPDQVTKFLRQVIDHFRSNYYSGGQIRDAPEVARCQPARYHSSMYREVTRGIGASSTVRPLAAASSDRSPSTASRSPGQPA